ncbi:transcription factor bHLH162-like [Hibiscus syriacus]|uniref:transcription factor bHLH162-like n=1 Tax=Hibiscus syriacus TaxID=106335 RepID=UPI001921CBAD|nr:transcription factor bHLH162-like [Hibiscus syriacus]
MEINPNNISSRTERKLIERNRRCQMKILYDKLNSLIPHYNSRESTSSLPDQLEEAAKYIKRLQTNLERMKQERRLTRSKQQQQWLEITSSREIHEMGSSLVIGLTTDREKQFVFKEMVRVLHEEGADIVNAGFSVVDDTAFHTIHFTVGMHDGRAVISFPYVVNLQCSRSPRLKPSFSVDRESPIEFKVQFPSLVHKAKVQKEARLPDLAEENPIENAGLTLPTYTLGFQTLALASHGEDHWIKIPMDCYDSSGRLKDNILADALPKGEYDMSASFNVSDLSPFDVSDMDESF